MENPIKMDDLGVPPYLETPRYYKSINMPQKPSKTIHPITSWIKKSCHHPTHKKQTTPSRIQACESGGFIRQLYTISAVGITTITVSSHPQGAGSGGGVPERPEKKKTWRKGPWNSRSQHVRFLHENTNFDLYLHPKTSVSFKLRQQLKAKVLRSKTCICLSHFCQLKARHSFFQSNVHVCFTP